MIATILIISIFSSSLNRLFLIGLSLITIACLTSVIVSYVSGRWFSMILFLIFVTGLLVLFGYMIAISPNQLDGKTKMWPITFILLTPIIPIKERKSIRDFGTTVSKILSYDNIILFLIAVLFLLYILVRVVVITFKSPKPLRMFSN